MSTHLNEWRGLRDSYAKRTVAALCRRFKHARRADWLAMVEKAKIVPIGDIEALRLFLPLFADMGEWSAVARFCWLAEIVWELECEELAIQQTTWGRDAYANKTKAAA